MPAEFLPPIGGYTFGLVSSVIIELLKKVGLHENQAPFVSLALGAIWTVAVMAAGYWPGAESWAQWLIFTILLFASLPLGAKTGYAAIVKPVARKRWNTEDRQP